MSALQLPRVVVLEKSKMRKQDSEATKDPVGANLLTPSTTATLPPRATDAAASPRPSGAVSSPSLFPFPCPAQPAGHAADSPTKPGAIRISLATEAVPVAVGPYLAEGLASRWQSYRKQLHHCQEECSEEAVHELRVATRRLLAQFTLLSWVEPSTPIEKARRILKRHLAALGDLRDIHVQRLFLEQKAARFPELVLFHAWLERRERCLVKSAAGQVSRFKTRKLEKSISALIADLTVNAGGARRQTRLESTVLQAAAEAFAEAVARCRAINLAEPDTIHRTRVAFKRFRYIMESLAPGLTGLSKRQLRALACYQRKMGLIQDLEVMQTCLTNYLRENQEHTALLRPFCRHLRQRRSRALRSFVKTADRLFEFWPPAALARRRDSASNRHVA